MAVIDLIRSKRGTAFSFELLPPIKGNGLEKIYSTIDTLREFNPLYINITNHSSEYIYYKLKDNIYKRECLCRRPCTASIASAIHNKYGIPVVPHIICSGYSREETEDLLLNLQFLGITDLLVLRGDKAKEDNVFKPKENGCSHAMELEKQINDFNNGHFYNGADIKLEVNPFHYGVACYPEKHIEAPNIKTDIHWLRKKVELGAEYAVTQMFFDNNAYFSFVEQARKEGIKIPIIPGIRPISKLSQLTVLPKTFNINCPQELANEIVKCKDDNAIKEVGREWCIKQCKELIIKGAPCIHFYTMGQSETIGSIVKMIF